jgi:hypothetical protein
MVERCRREQVDAMMMGLGGAMFALGLAQVGMVLRDRSREPAARRFFRGSTRVALGAAVGYTLSGLGLLLLNLWR